MIYRQSSQQRRSGVVLLVVITMLALFAAAAIGFVLYADAESATSVLAKQDQMSRVPDVDPQLLLTYYLNSLLFNRSELTAMNNGPLGIYSAGRGYELARNMYGQMWASNPNTFAFNGTGEPYVNTGLPPILAGHTYASIANINFSYYPADGFLLDPERLGPRTKPSDPFIAPYYGMNVPYTYPDGNNLYLASMNANGEILIQSYHRWYSDFGTLDPGNANWTSLDPAMKYMVLRPRPVEHPFFPLPLNAGGDVKNYLGGPGVINPFNPSQHFACDSMWIDLGFGVMTGPDGRKYKPLFAPLIIEQDSSINVNANGNVRAAGNVSASAMGLLPTEINPSVQGLISGGDYPNMFFGSGTTAGLYGLGPASVPGAGRPPTNPYPYIIDSTGPRTTSAINRTGVQVGTFLQATKVIMAGETSAQPLWSPFSLFMPNNFPDYANSTDAASELVNHHSLVDVFNPSYLSSQNQMFPDSEMEALLRYGDNGSPAFSSKLFKLLSKSLSDPSGRARRMLTTRSFDLVLPGAMPYLPAPTGNAGPYNGYQMGPKGYPTGPALANPTAAGIGGEFGNNRGWFYNPKYLQRLNINQALSDYPSGANKGVITKLTGPGGYSNALKSRQALAQSLFNLFVQVTMGGPPPGYPAPGFPAPTDPAYPTMQWLAQLAVNIVDFRDSDNFQQGPNKMSASYMTPFNWNPADPTPAYWVYGTEVPRLVLNEAYVDISNTPGDPFTNNQATQPFVVNMWVELFNPLPADPAIIDVRTGQTGAARLEMPLANGSTYPIYKLCSNTGNNLWASTPDAQILGTPNQTNVNYQEVNSYSPGNPDSPQQLVLPIPPIPGSNPPTPGFKGVNGSNQGFYVAGPANVTFPGGLLTPTLSAPNGLSFTLPNNTSPDGLQVNFFLQRLACPDLPPQPDPTNTRLPYNPYVTVDYISAIPGQDGVKYTATGANANFRQPQARSAYGKRQPFAGSPNQVVAQAPVPKLLGQPQHTFFYHNAVDAYTAVNSLNPNAKGQTLALPFNWLVQPDRPLVSPMEILQVSAYAPYQLTQKFMANGTPYGHVSMPAWLDSNARLFRAFEFLDSGMRATSVDIYGKQIPAYGRLAGKLNINGFWDKEKLRALADPQPGLSVFNTANVDAIFANLLKSRSPNGIPGPNDHPFKGFATGNVADTFLRNAPNSSTPLFQVTPNVTVAGNVLSAPVTVQPNLQNELINKISNNVTDRSNVFTVWLTVGFFDVTDDAVTTLSTAVSPGTNVTFQAANTQGSIIGVPWILKPGECIWVGSEPVRIAGVAADGVTFTANFQQAHQPGEAISLKGVLGNEVGIAEGRNVRHRMFAVVDRSSLSVPFQLTSAPTPSSSPMPVTTTIAIPPPPAATPPNPPPAPVPFEVPVTAMMGINNITYPNPTYPQGPSTNTNYQWQFQPGMQLVITDPNNTTTEQITILQVNQSRPGTITAIFANGYNPGAQFALPGLQGTVPGSILGNPGPQPMFDHRQNTSLVPYYSIIK